MVNVKPSSSRGKLRISQRDLVVFFLGALILPLYLISKFTTSTSHAPINDHPHIRANADSNDTPIIDDSSAKQPAIKKKQSAFEIHDTPIYKDDGSIQQHTASMKKQHTLGDTIRKTATKQPRSSQKKYKTYPGFTTKPSVLCGGHNAESCDLCPQGNGASWCNGECEWLNDECVRSSKLSHLHPDYFRITERYAFQPIMTNENNVYVNIIGVRSPFRGKDDEELYRFYQDEILFLGISSFEAFPLPPPNPYSAKFDKDYYIDMFPGFLHMMHKPEEHFPPTTKTILMSQSDFNLYGPETYYMQHKNEEKIYDFVYSGGDQDVLNDCVGWASYNKNFSFVREALEVMCSDEFNVTGVLVANKDKKDTRACTIPKACEGKIVQTTFLADQNKFFDYLSKARWAFLPQVCDASPRVSTQALSMNIPLLMNQNIMGGWKYMDEGVKSGLPIGEYFHDMSNFKDSLRRILDNTRGNNSPYKPLQFVKSNYGNERSGRRLYDFIKKNFGDRVHFPPGTTRLIPTGA